MPSDDVTAESVTDLGQLYLDVHQRMHRRVDQAMNAAGLSLARAKLLHQLAEHGPMNQAALATALGFAARSVTESVDALERDGLATRSDDPTDRRARIVAITPAGTDALNSAMAAKRTAMREVFAALDGNERAHLATLLGSIGSALAPE